MRWLVGALTAVLAAVFVGLAGAGGALYWNRVEWRAEQLTRSELAPLAKEEIPRILGYEYQTVESSLTDAYPLLTPNFRRDFEASATGEIIPQARQRQVISQISVVGVGVAEARRTSGSVLVYMNRTITAGAGEPLYEGNRVRVDYRKIGGKWLIDGIKPI